MNNRIKLVRKEKRLTQQAIADELGISLSNVQSYELGRRSPSAAFIKLFCEKYNVNEEWLKTGLGEIFNPVSEEREIAIIVEKMLKDEPEALRLRLTKILYSLTDEQLEVLHYIEEKIKNGS